MFHIQNVKTKAKTFAGRIRQTVMMKKQKKNAPLRVVSVAVTFGRPNRARSRKRNVEKIQ